MVSGSSSKHGNYGGSTFNFFEIITQVNGVKYNTRETTISTVTNQQYNIDGASNHDGTMSETTVNGKNYSKKSILILHFNKVLK